jgi:methyltransferase
MTFFWVYALLGFVVLQRGLELAYARRNAARLLARGGREIGREHYPLFIALHAGWLVAIILFARPPVEVPWLLLGAFALLQALRLWVIASLGPYWTTRIITMDGEPLRRRGPYRFVRHPNYCIVALEIPLLPFLLGLPVIAAVFGLLNLLLLAYRIREEDRALAERRRAASA